jgi:hypothetical protein
VLTGLPHLDDVEALLSRVGDVEDEALTRPGAPG